MSEKLERQIDVKPQKEINLVEQIRKLRKDVIAKMKEETKDRLENNPRPTEEEVLIGVFKEQIEPQVRGVVFELNKKGYKTTSSGFGRGGSQIIEGDFIIDENNKKKIEELDAEVLQGPEFGLSKNKTRIKFYPKEVDLQKITQKWDAIAEILPTIKHSESLGNKSEKFQKRYTQDHPVIEQKIKNYFERLK